MIKLLESQDFFGVRFSGRTFDCGSKLGFLTANAALALKHPELGPAFRSELDALMGE